MDSKTETVSDNELIAKFMGGVHECRDIMTYGGKRTGKWTFPDGLWCYDDQLDYNVSWSRLMPVVEKISLHIYESWEDSNGYKNVTHHERAYPRTFGMIDSEGKWLVRINRMPLEQEDTLIKATYKAVVEWIKLPIPRHN